jgi:hypothetical protein
MLRDIADGAAALRAHPHAIRLIGADIVCSLVEIMTGTSLQRSLPPAAIAGIALGSLLGPVLISLPGGAGALAACGAAATGYGLLLAVPRRRPRVAPRYGRLTACPSDGSTAP